MPTWVCFLVLAEPWHAVNDIHDQVIAVEVVEHHHVEWCCRRDYITNRTFPFLPDESEIRSALEGLWSASAVPGSDLAAGRFQCACGPTVDLPADLGHLRRHIFQIAIKDFLDPYTFNVKQVMKCCVGVLVPDGRMIPFCAYNSVGYREQVREQLAVRRRVK